MKKIYLAIAEQESLGIKNVLEKKIPDSDVSYIQSKEEILNILQGPFYMLITPIEYIDIHDLYSLKIEGTVIVLDPSISDSVVINHNLYKYSSLNNFRIALLTKGLENTEEKSKKVPANLLDDNIEIKPNNNDSLVKSTVSNIEEGNFKQITTAQPSEKIQDEIKIKSNSVEVNLSKPVNFEDYPPKITKIKSKTNSKLVERTEEIIKRNYSYGRWEGNKIIGVWSPLSANGVTTFIINFAIFLKKYALNIAVLEALTPNPDLKIKLTQYKSAPDHWVSFHEALYSTEYRPENVKWVFRGVDWLPIGANDLNDKIWTSDDISQYLQVIKKCHVGLVDFPFGKMEPYTRQALEHIDQLWIMVDNRHHKTSQWLNQMKETLRHIDVKLIVNRCFSLKKAEKIAEKFGYPLLATIPSFDEEIQKNEYEEKPLIDKLAFRKIVTPSYEKLAAHLLGSYFDSYKPGLWKKLKDSLYE